jgi:hypothetical protein
MTIVFHYLKTKRIYTDVKKNVSLKAEQNLEIVERERERKKSERGRKVEGRSIETQEREIED